jgi:acylaminoacyl-peptidase
MSLCSIDISGQNFKRLSPPGLNATSCTLCPSKSRIFYLSHRVGGPHASCAALRCYDLKTMTNTTIVPVVDHVSSMDHFPGFYSSFEKQCWICINNQLLLVMSTNWRSSSAIVTINVATGQIARISNLIDHHWTFLGATHDGYIVAKRSAPNHPGVLVMTKYCGEGCAVWQELDAIDYSENAQLLLKEISFSVHSIPDRGANVEAILVCPKNRKNRPLILMPHGGPHSSFTTNFSASVAAFVSHGYAVVLSNYTGSIGYGQDGINSLIGKIGDLDVADVHATALWASELEQVDATKISVYGGSHGGFLAAHLISRFSDFYKCGIMRNPVINIGAMVSDTDISDWCFTETGIVYDTNDAKFLLPEGLLVNTEYGAMFKASPCNFVGKSVSPCMIMLGKDDRRVPPSQGKRFAEVLKARGHEVKVLLFGQNGHALDGVEAELIGFEQAEAFMQKYLKD